jgi:glycosyltransferase involved in cell wall biosynthesis
MNLTVQDDKCRDLNEQTLDSTIQSLLSAKTDKEDLADLICRMLMVNEVRGLAYMEKFRAVFHRNLPSDPLVSVLITSYNTAEFIHACISSILLQTYENIEVVVVDDGSKDNTLDILSSIDDRRLKIFPFASNQGRVAALNDGLRKCSGAYIALMDSDDLASPLRIEKLLEYCLQGNYDAASSQVYEFGSSQDTCSVSTFATEEELLKVRMLFYNSVPHAATLFKADSIRKMGYKEGFEFAEDYEMLSRYVTEFKVGLLGQPLYLYRRRGDSATGFANEVRASVSQKRIIRSLFEKYMFSPTDEELELHRRMEKDAGSPVLDEKSLIALRKWINKLMTANFKSGTFDRETLKKILLNNYWSVYYYGNRHLHGLSLAIKLFPYQGFKTNIITLKEALKL